MNESPEANQELPKPHVEAKQPAGHEAPMGAYEAQLSHPETGVGSAPAQAQPGTSQFADPYASTPVGHTASATSLPPTSLPAVADDGDIIEREWVDKAKQIVAMTKADPRQENKEINKFKAEYIKKRYNKTIKVSED